jgi:hypothetical protein
VLDRSEQQYNTIRYQGEDRLVTTAVNTAFDDATVKKNVDTYGPKGDQLEILRNVAPLVALILGVLLVLAGLFLAHAGSRGRAH